MATRIENILSRARDTLADPHGERWSTGRLLRLLDEGQQDIAKHTKILKGQVDIQLYAGQHTYNLPEDVWLITRAAFEGCRIPLHSYAELDEHARVLRTSNYSNDYSNNYSNDYSCPSTHCWELDTASSISAVVYDRRNVDEVRVYPIPDEGIAKSLYTLSTPSPAFAGAEFFGVVTDITDYSSTSDFGVITDLYDPSIVEEHFSSAYGVVSSIAESDSVVHLWYIKVPSSQLTSVNDTLAIPSMFDTALKHYVVSMAFDDDYDTRFAEKAQKAASLYSRELDIIDNTDTINGIRDGQTKTTSYRNAF